MAIVNSVYGAEINIGFDDGEYTEIEPSRIEYFVIESRYENVNIVPVIMMSLKIPLDLHDRILKSYETAKFNLEIIKKDSSISSSLATNHISGLFSYICSNQEQNSAKNLNMSGKDDRSYVSTVIGLISSEIMENLRHYFNDIITETDTEQLIYDIAFKDIDGEMIMSPIKYSDEIDRFVIPPTTSRYKLLSYIFDRYPFYDTNFTFFMDFNNNVYLLDKTGEPVEVDEYPSTIFINITQKDDIRSMFPGSSIKNSASTLYVNAAQSRTSVNESLNQIANTISAFDYDNDVQELTISNNAFGGSDKKINLKTENAAHYKNDIVNSTVIVEVYQQSIDSGLITPNREFIVTQEGNYADYNGRYILSYKRELFVQNGLGSFNTTCSIGLKKVNEIEIAGAKEDTAASVRHKAFRTSGSQRSSASYGARNGSTKSTASDRSIKPSTKPSTSHSSNLKSRKV